MGRELDTRATNIQLRQGRAAALLDSAPTIILPIVVLVIGYFVGRVDSDSVLVTAGLLASIGMAVLLADLITRERLHDYFDHNKRALSELIALVSVPRGGERFAVMTRQGVLALELAAKEVWIYAYDLAWESDTSEFTAAVRKNLERHVRYRYIIPNTPEAHIRAKRVASLFAHSPLIEFRARQANERLLQFGITLYNPGPASDDSVATAVFFPHFRAVIDSDEPPFLCLRGNGTREIEEELELVWETATRIG